MAAEVRRAVRPPRDRRYTFTIGIDSAGPFRSTIDRDGCRSSRRSCSRRSQSIDRRTRNTGISDGSLENPKCKFNGIARFYVLSNGTQDESEAEASEEIDLTRGLHAKCYVIDTGSKAHVFTGSANATEAAFRNNVEFLVELVGSRSKFGIDALFAREDGKTCLGDMLEEFKPQPRPIDSEEEGRRAAVERVRQLLSALKIVAKVSAADDRFDVQLQFSEPVRLEPGLKVTCWPVTLGQGWSAPVAPDATMASFTGLSFEALTAFFAFEVKIGESARTEVFVLNVELQGAPADRRERLLIFPQGPSASAQVPHVSAGRRRGTRRRVG